MIFAALTFITVTILDTSGEQKWSYQGNTGPSHWPGMFPTCGGTRQSPVDINTEQVVKSSDRNYMVTTINYEKADTKSVYTLTNNGRSLQMDIKAQEFYKVVVGKSIYTPMQVHFHWGKKRKQGSEHTINGQAAEMEMHIVHRNTKYPTSDASKHGDGLLVIATFVQESFYSTSGLKHITKALKGGNLNRMGSRKKLQPFALQDILPGKVSGGHYYLYDGSLTTPPCSQVVQWVVLKKRLKIAWYDLKRFRSVRTADGTKLQTNYRPTQSLNSRKVYLPSS